MDDERKIYEAQLAAFNAEHGEVIPTPIIIGVGAFILITLAILVILVTIYSYSQDT